MGFDGKTSCESLIRGLHIECVCQECSEEIYYAPRYFGEGLDYIPPVASSGKSAKLIKISFGKDLLSRGHKLSFEWAVQRMYCYRNLLSGKSFLVPSGKGNISSLIWPVGAF